jgi:hypothetical protein
MDAVELWCRVTVFDPDGCVLGRIALCGGGTPGVWAVDRLARLELAAKSTGGSVSLASTSAALAELLELAGLAELGGR